MLPFANLSDDPENEYFSDGLAEEIRNRLARVPGLKVAARSSSVAFKDRGGDARGIGRRLNVAAILEGGMRKQADTVRISLQLVNTTEGFAEQGVVNPLARYWAASANGLLGRTARARGLLSEARSLGWNHGWWERLDWNLRPLNGR